MPRVAVPISQRTYEPRVCMACTASYTPSGPNQKQCVACSKERARRCPVCEEIKPADAFYTRCGIPEGACKPCRIVDAMGREAKEKVEQPEKWKARRSAIQRRSHAAHREENNEYHRWYKKAAKYGVTRERFDQMLAEQKGVCAICGGLGKYGDGHRDLDIDHCHDTSAVRGLLCANCNRGIGMLMHDPNRLRAALVYLERPVT